MKFLTVIVLSVALAAPVFANESNDASSGTRAGTLSGTSYNTTIVTQPNQRWIFQRVSAIANDDGTKISGRLTAVRRAGLSKGHVDVAAFSPEGTLLAEDATHYSPSTLTRKMKSRGGVRFTIDFPQQLPRQSVIKLSFHENDQSTSIASLHAVNILR